MAEFNSKATIKISCGTPDAIVKYTIDGTDPSASNGSTYSTTFDLFKNTTVKAIGLKDGLLSSEIATNSVTVKLPNDESYYAKTINTDNAGITFNASLAATYGNTCKCRYTTDGTDPTAATANIIAEGETITITKNCTFKAIITADNNVNSDIVSFEFTTLKVQTPVITVS